MTEQELYDLCLNDTSKDYDNRIINYVSLLNSYLSKGILVGDKLYILPKTTVHHYKKVFNNIVSYDIKFEMRHSPTKMQNVVEIVGEVFATNLGESFVNVAKKYLNRVKYLITCEHNALRLENWVNS